MKFALTTLVLLGAVCAFGQATPTSGRIREVKFELTDALAPIYTSLADTITNPTYISRSEPVTVVGVLDTNWAAIRRGSKEYIISTRYLKGYVREAVRPAVILPVYPSTGKVTYSEVIQVPGVKQDDLYIRAKVWFIDNFNDAHSVIRNQEREAGLMIGRAWTPVTVKYLGTTISSRLWYTVRLSFKDGRYKYEIYDFAEDGGITTTDLHPVAVPIESTVFVENKPSSSFGRMIQQRKENADGLASYLTQTIKKALAQPATGGDW